MKKAKEKVRRLLAVAMSAMLVLSLTAVSALGSQEGKLTGGSITIENAKEGQTYSIYQILYLESYDATSGAYAYKANSAWEDWLNTQTQYVSIDAQGYVTWVEGASAADFAKAAQAYAKGQSISPDLKGAWKTQVVKEEGKEDRTDSVLDTDKSSANSVSYNNSKLCFSDLKLGYYLVDSTLGTLCSLDTTNPDVTIKEKNAEPTNEKTVEEDSTGNYGNKNDADIGQTVNFKSKITLPKGSENVVFHDKMDKGLTLDASSIKVYTDEAMTTELAVGNYTVTATDLTDDCTFEVSFAKTYLDGLTAGSTTVYVAYSATLNENAVVGGDGNSNESKLTYGENNDLTTTPSETKTYTWSFDVLKYANGDESKVLSDAKFVLLNSEKSKVATIVNGKLTGWAVVPTAAQDGTIAWPKNTTLTTGANGKISIAGLDADTYYLREIEAPAGYNKLTDDVKVEIKPTESADSNGQATLNLKEVIAKVENKSGSELPSTGGMGTTLLYVIGGILVVSAGVALVTRRRMGSGR